MKVGSIGYAHSRGLGHLLKDFHDEGVVNEVYVVEHGRIPRNRDWYPDSPSVKLSECWHKPCDELREWCKDFDLMIFFETPFDWGIFDHCRKAGVKTVLIPMYECFPDKPISEPDFYLCPSLLDVEYFKHRPHTFLPLPVSKRVKWRLRDQPATHFIHNGGYLGMRGREGTTLLIDAMQYVKSPIRLTIRVQEHIGREHLRIIKTDSRIEYLYGIHPFNELFSQGQCYVAPQKYNGCSLPLQEAFASGLCCITTDRFPTNTWLPNEPMIPVASYSKQRHGGFKEFDEANVNPLTIAQTIDAWYGKDVSSFSLQGRDYGILNSWNALRSKYLDVLGQVIAEI